MSEYELDAKQIAKKVTEMPNITTRVNGYTDEKDREWIIVETITTKWYAKKFFDNLTYNQKKEK